MDYTPEVYDYGSSNEKYVYPIPTVPGDITLRSIRTTYPMASTWHEITMYLLKYKDIPRLSYLVSNTISLGMVHIDSVNNISTLDTISDNTYDPLLITETCTGDLCDIDTQSITRYGDLSYVQGRLVVPIRWTALFPYVTNDTYKYVQQQLDSDQRIELAYIIGDHEYLSTITPNVAYAVKYRYVQHIPYDDRIQVLDYDNLDINKDNVVSMFQRALDLDRVDVVSTIVTTYGEHILRNIIDKRYPINSMTYLMNHIVGYKEKYPSIASIIYDDNDYTPTTDDILYYDSLPMFIRYAGTSYSPTSDTYVGPNIAKYLYTNGHNSMINRLDPSYVYSICTNTSGIRMYYIIMYAAKYGYYEILAKYYSSHMMHILSSIDNIHPNTSKYIAIYK